MYNDAKFTLFYKDANEYWQELYGDDLFDYCLTNASATTLNTYADLKDLFSAKYNTREIAFETPEMFVDMITRKIKLLYTKYLDFFTKHSVTNDGLTNYSGNATTKSTYNDTPMTELDDANYATSITDGLNTSSGRQNATISDMLENYRQKYKNIANDLIQEFDGCFIQLFD